MLKNFPYYLLGVSLLILGLSIGFFAGKNYFQSPLPTLTTDSPEPSPATAVNTFLTTQTATVRGKITKINERNLTIENLLTKETESFKAANSVSITKAGASPSSSLSSVELNKEVFVSLLMNNGNYEVIGIQYPLQPASLPPIRQ
jgi:hypothetical protein